ncbi:hypothetical protein HYH02_010906 [Chlamydomonas schloesseri]|uniref:Uncharacterized protein n=1 Tax=Chlamydomonas schloesseri TaxID=2026947 RepID=A0A835T6Q2_9CHLO|nr:hypothetical protein HYH02_010906 [Chlamydomonas schloesseri]|eukprot:KAG2438451.1 hypothetical protein HYH02_010906 [Chlamydomonas schloesseri]
MTVTVPPQAKRVKYVYIPADVHEPIQEREIDVPEGREVECLLDELKDHFKAAGGTKTAAQREAQRQQLIAQVGAESAAKLSEQMLAAALDMQMVETLALLVNNRDSGFVGVNMYCDDQAQVKELPLNVRASNIADCCGKPMQVNGDVFLARLFDNDDAFVRLDLPLAEVTSGAAWVAAAAAQAAKRLQQGDRAADFMAQLQQQQQRQKAGAGAVAAAPKATVRELTPAEAEKEAGNAAVKRGDLVGAVERYTAALGADPGMTAAANNRALALLRLGRHEEAEADCSRVLEDEPRNVKALLRRAACRVALGRRDGAVGDLQAVLALEPHNRDAQAELTKLAPPPPPLPEGAAAAAESAAAGSQQEPTSA